MREVTFKGMRGLCLENGSTRVIVLPGLGGKVASFFHKQNGFEVLFQNKASRFHRPSLYSDFARYDASGFDDCFPSIASSVVDFDGQEVTYPDHGEVWSASFDYRVIDEHLALVYQSRILPYRYEKKISLVDHTLQLTYGVRNTGYRPIKCIWAMHCLLNYQEDMEIRFPADTTEILNVIPGSLGDEGTIHGFPLAQTTDGRRYRLDRVPPPTAPVCSKYYVNNPTRLGECGVYYPSTDVHFDIRYDPEALPYLGFWVTAGGYRGDYNCALEPCNGFYDSIEKAECKERLYLLRPGTNMEFTVNLTLR
jgi:galactose mutarotase-like enzyme